jgi:UDPglucose 6-dehydrogenase
MKVCVFGLWHLGSVTAACLASLGHEVVGLDSDVQTIDGLRKSNPPLSEPGLPDLVRAGLGSGRLRFTTDVSDALRGAEILWVCYDTTVGEDDRADVDSVMARVESLFDKLEDGALVLVSSQLPVGSVRRLEVAYGKRKRVTFACSPENLRLGKAIDAFLRPDRIVVGTRSESDRAKIAALLAPLKAPIEWMSVESAEMAKHALNAFLATSIAFINEIAALCEEVGADAQEVARGVKSDARIGPRAYLTPGAAFAGGTLARDVYYLTTLGRPVPLIANVKVSNDAHRTWAQTALTAALGTLKEKTVALWGLTYKPGTDTLRRSAAVELCRWLIAEGARVQAHDPAVTSLPKDLAAVRLCRAPEEALRDADALVVSTEWPEFRSARAANAKSAMVVIDPNRFLASTFGARSDLRYFAVGKGRS